jgi:glycosyltransferase involved in cell wall biosynthesis
MMRVLMSGPHPSARGGMTTCIDLYRTYWNDTQATLRYVSTYRECGVVCKLLIFAFALLQVLWYLLTWRPHIIHLHFSKRAGFYRQAILFWLAKAFGTKTIMHAHSGHFPAFYEQQPECLQRFIRHTLRSADVVFVLAPQWVCYYQTLAAEARGLLLYYPIYMPPQITTPTQPASVLALARLVAAKGVPEMLRAAQDLQDTHPDVKFVLAGDGDIAGWQAQATDNVHFPGWLDGSAKVDALQRATVFMQPSHAEGMPLAVLEAMSYGLPVVTSDVGGLPDLVQHNVTGLLVPAGDVAALTDALRRLLDDDDLRQRLGHAARAYVQQHHAVDSVMAQLYGHYNDLCNRAITSSP